MSGDELRAWRARLGLTQARLAERLGLPRATVARWEAGLMPIRHPEILRLALERLAQAP